MKKKTDAVQEEQVENQEEQTAQSAEQNAEQAEGFDLKIEPCDDTSVSGLQKERDDYLNALVRERADFENFKKRNAVAVSRAYSDGQADTVAAMLPVIDNLDRALAAVKEDSPLKTGVEMVLRQFTTVLKDMGAEEIEAYGKPFDPNLHNAVAQEEAAENEESGIVKEVLMKGYSFKDRVIRHSMVKVTC